MSRFKDQLAKDIKSVFINPLEFAAPHNVNGSTVDCVVDSDLLEERGGARSEFVEGVFVSKKMIFISAEDIEKPVIGQLFRLDGDRYTVYDVAEDEGLLTITIGANES